MQAQTRAHARPHLFTEYPRVMANAAREYLTVDGVPREAPRGLPRMPLLY